MSERDAGPADAIRSLRAAVTAGTGVEAAARRAFHEDPEFAWCLLGTAATRRFGPDFDVRQITALTARIREQQPGFPGRVAEQVIRWMLGEAQLAPEIDWAAADCTEVFVAVLTRLFDEWRPDEPAIQDLFSDTRVVPGLDPANRWAFVHRAELHRHAGRLEHALADYDRAIAMEPDDARAIAARGQTNFGLQRRTDAWRDFNRALELDSALGSAIGAFLGIDDIETFLRQRSTLSQEEIEDVEDIAFQTRIIEEDPENALALICRGAIYNKQGRHSAALADLTRAVELDPDNYLAVVTRADCLSSLGRLDDAAADFDRAADLDPTSSSPHVGRGTVRLRQERYDEALSDFRAALEREPSDWGATANRAATYSALGRHEDALADCERALALGHPDPGWVLAARADACRHLGRYEEALASYAKAIEADDLNADAFAGRARTYLELGRRDMARHDLSRAMQLDPELAADVAERLAELD